MALGAKERAETGSSTAPTRTQHSAQAVAHVSPGLRSACTSRIFTTCCSHDGSTSAGAGSSASRAPDCNATHIPTEICPCLTARN